MKLCQMPYRVRASVAVFTSIVSSIAYAQTPATGVRARSTPADYAVSRQTSRATYAVSLIPPEQVKRLFPVDISKTYLIFEVACYPSQSGDVALNPGDFLVKSESRSEYIHPSDAATIASLIQDKNTPPQLPSRGPEVTTAATVGYDSGRDPYTGQRVHGTYTAAEVGVNNRPDNYPPPPPPRHGSSTQDRQALENQLADKLLPQGTFHAPVAGYLYFVADALKKVNGSYDLQFLGDDSGKVDLPVPNKRK